MFNSLSLVNTTETLGSCQSMIRLSDVMVVYWLLVVADQVYYQLIHTNVQYSSF